MEHILSKAPEHSKGENHCYPDQGFLLSKERALGKHLWGQRPSSPQQAEQLSFPALS